MRIERSPQVQANLCSLYRNRLMGFAAPAVPAAHAAQWGKTSVKGIDPTPLVPEGGATG